MVITPLIRPPATFSPRAGRRASRRPSPREAGRGWRGAPGEGLLALAMTLLLATAASAETFRFFGSAGAESQLTPANGQSPLNPGNIAGVPYQTNVADITAFAEAVADSRAWKMRLKVRGDASDRSSDQVRVGEGFIQLNPRPWLDVTAGRVIEKWGTAYAWNPTAFVSPLKNPTDPNDRRSSYRGIDMLKADLFMRGTNVSLYAMEHGAFAGRVYRLIANTDVSLLFRRDRDATREGLSVARVFGDALELHGEVAYVRQPGAAVLHFIQAVAGGQYTFQNNVNLVFELYHGGDGLSTTQWRAFCDTVDRNLLLANRQYAPLKMGRNYSFTRIDWPSQSQKNDVELIAIANLRDRSSIVRLTMTRKLRPSLNAYIIETEFIGGDDSEFAYIQVKRATTFGVRYYF